MKTLSNDNKAFKELGCKVAATEFVEVKYCTNGMSLKKLFGNTNEENFNTMITKE